MADQEWMRLDFTREEAENHLRPQEPGFFVVRNSSRPGQFTLTIRQPSNEKPCHHVLIVAQNGKFALQRSKRIFTSIADLVLHYSKQLPSENQLSCKLRLPGSVADIITEADIGLPCDVDGYAVKGKLRWVGDHFKNGFPRCGVELDHPMGKNNGTVGGDYYFSCPENCGVLCHPDKVTIIREGVANLNRPLPTPGDDAPPPVPMSNRPSRHASTSRAAMPRPEPEPEEDKFMFDGEIWWIGMIQGHYAAEYLANGDVGDFIVRESQSTEDCYVLGILLDKGPTEYKIKYENGMFSFYNADTRSEVYPTMQLLIDNMVEACRPASDLFRECPRLQTRHERKKARAKSEKIDARMAEMTNEVIAVPTDFGLESEAWYVDTMRADAAEEEMSKQTPGTFIIVPHINDTYVLLITEKKSRVKRIAIERMGGVYKVDGAIQPSLSDIQAGNKYCTNPGRKIFDPSYDEQRARMGTAVMGRNRGASLGRPPMPRPNEVPAAPISQTYIQEEYISDNGSDEFADSDDGGDAGGQPTDDFGFEGDDL